MTKQFDDATDIRQMRVIVDHKRKDDFLSFGFQPSKSSLGRALAFSICLLTSDGLICNLSKRDTI